MSEDEKLLKPQVVAAEPGYFVVWVGWDRAADVPQELAPTELDPVIAWLVRPVTTESTMAAEVQPVPRTGELPTSELDYAVLEPSGVMRTSFEAFPSIHDWLNAVRGDLAKKGKL